MIAGGRASKRHSRSIGQAACGISIEAMRLMNSQAQNAFAGEHSRRRVNIHGEEY